ncbi:MAG: hypothetical protein RLY23_1163, partial [Actinomycetota bacterium]
MRVEETLPEVQTAPEPEAEIREVVTSEI